MSLYCDLNSLNTESDVEQKFIYQLLTAPMPSGFGFRDSDIQTKQVLKSYSIGKGGKQKIYYPDYLITMRGMPLLVIEAKTPGEDLNVAYAEARLYAAEVNAKFSHKINVCNKIIVSNGAETWAGHYDCLEPELKLSFTDFNTENKLFNDLLNFCSKKELENQANEPYIKSRGKAIFKTPVAILGGKRVQDEELEENKYGRTLIFENRNIFDPETEQDRIEIVKNAYIKSSKREQHVEPIYKELKQLKLPSDVHSTKIATNEPKEIINKLSENINSEKLPNSLMLLIGNVGSGKTTFIRYFKEMVLNVEHKDLSNNYDWVFLNMNFAPVNNVEIYNWIKEKIISDIKNNYKDINFNDLGVLKQLFKSEIKDFEEGVGQIIKEDEANYKLELYRIVSECTKDNEKLLKSILNYLKLNGHKVPIIVLDNCDKRDKKDQLLMFEVSQWIRDNYSCIVFLPMRDSTYDIYKNEPPLDTMVKDLVFRIDPADLLKVLQARLDYLSRINESSITSYPLANGINVRVKPKEQIEYFKCILMAIRKSPWAMKIFYNLSNGNIREAIQLFEDFCKSGHIKTGDIFNIKTLGEEFELPSHKIINALLRKNRKYFSEEKSNFANLFYSNFDDDFPDPFVRIDILRWLKTFVKKEGPSQIKGYHKVETIIKDLQTIGHNEAIILRETKQLIKKGLILSETQSSEVDYCDLIKVSPSGSLHLSLLKNLSYLGACAEDVIYKDSNIMTKISNRLALPNYLEMGPLIENAKDMIEYLRLYREEFLSHPEVYMKNEEYLNIYNLEDANESINKLFELNPSLVKHRSVMETYPSGTEIRCKATFSNKCKNSLVCIFGDNLRGFLATTEDKFKLSKEIYASIKENDELLCKIIEYKNKHSSFNLEFIKKI